MPSTKAYSVGLVALSVVAVLFAGLWLIYYNAYNDMLNRYEKLLDRHAKLLDMSEKLVDRYVKILVWLGNNFGTDTLLPGYYRAIPIVIPIDDTGFVNVTVISKQSSVKVYIFDIRQFVEWSARGSFSSYYLYEEGSYIDRKVTLSPGVYFVVIVNPNKTPTSISYIVKTMYKSLYDLKTMYK